MRRQRHCRRLRHPSARWPLTDERLRRTQTVSASPSFLRCAPDAWPAAACLMSSQTAGQISTWKALGRSTAKGAKESDMWNTPGARLCGDAVTRTAVVILGTSVKGEAESHPRRRALGGNRYLPGDWHHPRVFRSTVEYQWCWECRCGASSCSAHLRGQQAAAIAALVHVGSQGVSR